MISKSLSSRLRRLVRTDSRRIDFPRGLVAATWLLIMLGAAPRARAGDAPAWMHALVNAPLPAHDEKTPAVLLFSERTMTVRSADKITTTVREAYKILRLEGRDYGSVKVYFDLQTKISSLRAWCIPSQGKDYVANPKDAMDVAPLNILGGELVSDLHVRVLQIPAADPGNIVGYEYEREARPFLLQHTWDYQETIPVREAHLSLQLPPGWEYRATWLNAPEVAPTAGPSNQWSWVVTDVKALKSEFDMPPRRGIEAQMVLNFFPQAGGEGSSKLTDWNAIGVWYNGLVRGRTDASPEIKRRVSELIANQDTLLGKMRALAGDVQRGIRYVAIELGIGGVQPHAAAEVFQHHYGDCKDKATLFRSMLQEIGATSFYLIINTQRGSVTPEMPGRVSGFNHAIVAITLPDSLNDPSLVAIYKHPKFGRILIFDPTDELTPFGRLRGDLQASYALLVTPDGGELIETPRMPPASSGINRLAHLTLDAQGTLSGQVHEVRLGDYAHAQRNSMRNVALEKDRIKPVETLLSHSLSAFALTRASVTNLEATDQPIEFEYSFVAERFAKFAGGLMLVRPRVLGTRASNLLDTKEPREQAVAFEGPERLEDTFEITIPSGYVADDLPPPVNLDYSFASYHSKTEAQGNILRYTRSYETKELLVPLARVDELRKLYHIIAGDERNNAVLKPSH